MPCSSSPVTSNLRRPSRFITSNSKQGHSELHSSTEFGWKEHDIGKLVMAVVYTTSSPLPILDGDADLRAHEEKLSSGLGLVSAHGSVLRCVDLAPGYACDAHRTKSLDYGIVVEGSVDMVLESGVTRLSRGDVVVQRATMHLWRNPSPTEWARMVFVLLDCHSDVQEHLGRHEDDVLPSGN